MSQSPLLRAFARKIVTTAILLVGGIVVTKYAILSPVENLAREAATATTCRKIWENYSLDVIERVDTQCLQYVQ